MAEYKPQLPFNVPAVLLKRSDKPSKVNGVNRYTYTESMTFYCSSKSYGGTERVVNGVAVIEDTWQIDTWYHPAFGKGDRIRFMYDDGEFDIMASPENINRRGQYMRFKVVRVGG